jgi:putative tricarboxylic transport membrane protein
MLPEKEEWPIALKAIGRSSILGFFIGLIPGTGASIPTVLSYTIEKKLSKHPEKFGTGVIEGVAGPETANNAYCGGAMIPLLTLGIPTSPAMAVLVGGFLIHGITPGPSLFNEHPEIVWPVIASMFIGNLLLVIMNLPLASIWAQITRVPNRILFPIIVIISLLGVFSVNNSIFDVYIMVVAGIIAYFLKEADFPMTPFILTFILGDRLELSLDQSMTILRGNPALFFTRPICAVLLVIVFCVLVFSALGKNFIKEKLGEDESEM